VTGLQESNNVNNIDLLGATNTFTQVGIATGNQPITKAGILGNAAVRAIKGIQATKGMTGVAKTGGITSSVEGFADAADQALFGD
jgi:hypothetical protein